MWSVLFIHEVKTIKTKISNEKTTTKSGERKRANQNKNILNESQLLMCNVATLQLCL